MMPALLIARRTRHLTTALERSGAADPERSKKGRGSTEAKGSVGVMCPETGRSNAVHAPAKIRDSSADVAGPTLSYDASSGRS
jgi:hypothetical protein